MRFMGKGFSVLVLFSVICSGCTYNVAFKKPDDFRYAEKIPIDVFFAMDRKARDLKYEGHAWSSGIANTWVVPVGDTAHEYAISYLSGAFRSFMEIDPAAKSSSEGFLIRLDEILYRMEGQAAHSTISVSVVSPAAKEVLNKKYPEDGPSGFGRVLAGGAFAQKSAIRQSTHVVFENTFKKLVEDIRSGYKEWMP
ncbi:MAG TPA: hypothetical protein DD658_06395 [Deltaproteobacteria bacterium]|nr:hypothetical protein [Deltaproteobacteria bacterium]